MPVCQYYLRGNCKYGDRCRNEHPNKGATQFSSRNPFESLAGGNSTRGGGSFSVPNKPYSLDRANITSDLTQELPLYILSAYGPGKDAPVQLFGGPLREQSFEELRLRHYELSSIGNQQQAIIEAQTLVQNAEQQIKVALGDVDGAINYIINGENEHPNRTDICKAYSQGVDGNNQLKPVFGQPSGLNGPAAFQTAPYTTSTFGQPSTSFGQPSVPSSSFGKPSFLGQNSTQASTSGQSSNPENLSVFKNSRSVFGQPSIQLPFAAAQVSTSQSSGASVVATAQPAQSAFSFSNSFGQPSSFGQPLAPAATSGLDQRTIPAGSSNTSQAPSSGSNAFGKPTPSTNPFGQPAVANSNLFGQAGSTQTSTPFGQVSTAPMFRGQTDTSAVGSASAGTTRQPFSNEHSNAQRDSQGRLTTWKGKPVSYINDEPCFKGKNDCWEKIWFPDGPPIFNKAVELPIEDYDETTKESYKFLGTHGQFKGGNMPYLPPRREWCNWDF